MLQGHSGAYFNSKYASLLFPQWPPKTIFLGLGDLKMLPSFETHHIYMGWITITQNFSMPNVSKLIAMVVV